MSLKERHCYKQYRLKAAAVIIAIPLMSLLAQGQGNYTAGTPRPESMLPAQSNSTTGSLTKAVPYKIRLSVKDSSLAYVVRAIGSIVKRPVVFNDSDPQFRKKINIQLHDATIEEAFDDALKGTNLSANLARDGRTLIISSAQRMQEQPTTERVQNGSVLGQVLDSSTGKGIDGATVVLIGTKLPVVSMNNGTFMISNVPQGQYQISVKLLGYNQKTVGVKVESGAVQVRIVLSASTTSLNEVLTTATGAQRRVEIPSDIVKIDADKIRERAPVRSAIDLIEAAQVPGVLVTRGGGDPGAPSRIRIRGIGSISENNDPVIIMDGVWIDMTSTRLNDIDPAAIETIEIVRGPSAATLYGQDAANGVIVITSKRGTSGPAKWNLSYARDWGQTYGKKPPVFTAFGVSSVSESTILCPISALLDYSCSRQDSVVKSDPNHDLLSREGTETVNRYSARMDGGTSDVNYSITFSNNSTTGVRRVAPIDLIRYRILGYGIEGQFMKPSKRTQNSITTALRFLPKPKLSMNLTLTGTQTALKDNKIGPSGSGWPSSMFDSRLPASLNIDTTLINNRSVTIAAVEGPETSFNGIIAGTVQYNPGMFVLNGNLGYERSDKNSSMFERNTYCQVVNGGAYGECRDTLGRKNENSSKGNVYTARFNVSTILPLGRFSNVLDIRPSVGGDYKRQSQLRLAIGKDKIPIGDRSLSGGVFVTSQDMVLENALAGWYINSTIGLFKRIYFDIGLRQDIGSAITSSKNTKYPKIGGAWVISEEPFWRVNGLVNTLRLRSAVGHAAVQPTLSDINGAYQNGIEFIDGKYRRTAALSGTGNSVLQPERAIEFEVGFDSDLINDRVNLIATYAQKENRNTMISRSLPPSLGGGTRKENIAKVQNRNLEISATARAVESRSMLLVLSYALTLSDNLVKSLGPNIAAFGTSDNRVAKGYPIAGAWKQRVMGYRDLNDDGLLSLDELLLSDSTVYLGWTQPRNRGSYGVSLTLMNHITLDSRFESQGKYVQTYRMSMSNTTLGQQDQNSSYADQSLSVIEQYNSARPVSHVRWNSASVTYHLPKPILKRIGGRIMSVSLQGRNLGLWSNYIGRDPGINTSGLPEGLGDHGNTPPTPRLYVLDFRIGY